MPPVNDPYYPRIFEPGALNAWNEAMWLADGTPRRLHAMCYIGGTPMHVTAVRVLPDANGNDVAADPGDQEEIDGLYRLYEGGTYQTTTINDYEYLVYAVPHQD